MSTIKKKLKTSPHFIISIFYLSTVKETKFQVEVRKPLQRRKAEFQREHSRSPNIPSPFISPWSFVVKDTSSSIKEQNKSAELWNEAE